MEGRPVKFHSYSDLRRDPVCEHFGLCGGCKWQFMSYEHQLHFKKEVKCINKNRRHRNFRVAASISL